MPKRITRNKFEEGLLQQLKRSNVKFSYESEKIPYILSGNYIPDFIIDTPTGKVYIEAKGYFRPEAKRKMVAVKKQNPNKDFRIIFYSMNKSYVRWAERHGFKYAFYKVPQDWLDGF